MGTWVARWMWQALLSAVSRREQTRRAHMVHRFPASPCAVRIAEKIRLSIAPIATVMPIPCSTVLQENDGIRNPITVETLASSKEATVRSRFWLAKVCRSKKNEQTDPHAHTHRG